MSTIDAKLAELGLTLPEPAAPVGSYVPVVRSGNLLYISGQISRGSDGLIAGRLGDGLALAEGQKAAGICALNILREVAGVTPLDNISRILKLTVLVASAPEFHDQHLVANGASDLLAELLGDAGKHARAAFGVSALPFGAAVEIDAVIEIKA